MRYVYTISCTISTISCSILMISYTISYTIVYQTFNISNRAGHILGHVPLIPCYLNGNSVNTIPLVYTLVLMECHHSMVVPLAFKNSMQFDSLACYCCRRRCQRHIPGRCSSTARSTSCNSSTTARAGLGVRADSCWVSCPPTRPARHPPAKKHADRQGQ
jgi:hypothetical protein